MLVVFAIFAQILPPFTDCSHLIIVDPTLFPDNVIAPLFAPVHTVNGVAGESVPGVVVAFTVTTCVVVAGPLQPAAEAVILVVPLQLATNVTTPVEALILFPPEALLLSILYKIAELLLSAAVVMLKVPAPWQRFEANGENALIVTVGVIVTVCDDAFGPLQPVAEAVMTEVPLQPAA